MTSYLMPLSMLYMLLGFCLICLGFSALLGFRLYRYNNADKILMIDKDNRWKLYHPKLYGKKHFTLDKKKYLLIEKSGIVSEKGKALYVFSENKPEPMQISYNAAKWLDSESIMNVINNELLKMMLKATKTAQGVLLFGAIAAIIGAAASCMMFLSQVGVLNLGT